MTNEERIRIAAEADKLNLPETAKAWRESAGEHPEALGPETVSSLEAAQNQDSKPPTSILKAAIDQINAIHAAFGAPGDYGYESREGRALYSLYKFQVELREAIAEAQKIPVAEVESARIFGDDIEHWRIRVGALVRECDELRADIAKLDRVIAVLDMADSDEEPADRIREMIEYIEVLRQQGDFTRLPVVTEFLRQCFTRVNAPHWFGSSERKDLIESVVKSLRGEKAQ